jgi:hypothetical protein
MAIHQKRSRRQLILFSAMIMEQDMKMANDEEQLQGVAFPVKWVSESIHPFKNEEDEGLLEFVAKKYIFFLHVSKYESKW